MNFERAKQIAGRAVRWFSVLLLATAAWLFLSLCRPESIYHGQPTSYWREEIRKYHDQFEDRVAIHERVKEFLGIPREEYSRGCYDPFFTGPWDPSPNPEIIPVLLELIQDGDPRIRAYAAGYLRYYPESDGAAAGLIRLLDDRQETVRLAAINSLSEIGSPAEPALPKLRGLLEERQTECHVRAALAVWKIGREAETAVPVLAEALGDGRVTIRQRAVSALREMGPDAKGAFPSLCAAARDGDRIVRLYSVGVLGELGAVAVAPLIEALRNPDAVVRSWAAEALDKIGPDARSALPALLALADDPKEHVRQAAEQAARKIASAPGAGK